MEPRLRRALIGLVRLYQRTLSHVLATRCRFYPSCSQYAVEALETHGSARGLWLTLRRLSRCHPLGGKGYDPVPEREDAAPEPAPEDPR